MQLLLRFFAVATLIIGSTSAQAQYIDTLYLSDEEGEPVVNAYVYETNAKGVIDSSTQQLTDYNGIVVLRDIGLKSKVHISNIQCSSRIMVR